MSDEANIPDEWVEKVARSLYVSSPDLYDVGYDKSPDKDVYDDAARKGIAVIAPAIRQQAIRTTAEPLAKWIEENVAGSQVMRRDDGDWFVVT